MTLISSGVIPVLSAHEEFEAALDQEIARLSAIVDDLLTLARADSGQSELERDLLDLSTLVAEVMTRFHSLADAKGIVLDVEGEQQVYMIGDPLRMRQLISNILDNAVKYTPPGGRILVHLTRDEAIVLLRVADTGIGIAQDHLPRIFDRFYRADEARARGEGGTGLGLAIASWCARAHGGCIGVTSTAGHGSVFTVTLPAAILDDDRPTNANGSFSPVHLTG